MVSLNNRKILIIVGPTAVGKTTYAIAAAKERNGEIISADSMQLYKYMDIGSAKPTPAERKEAIHHLVDQIDPTSDFSVAAYQELAKKAIEEVFRIGKLPIVSGGTGLYVNSLIYDMNFNNVSKIEGCREKLKKEAEDFGSEYLHNKLKEKDPPAAERIHPNNIKKVIRALEILETDAKSLPKFEESFVKTKDYDFEIIGLSRDRNELYDRINRRVDLLLEAGLVEEVKTLLKMGLTKENISMKGIGYKEILGYLNEEYDKNQAIYLIKRNSRHYAKRQITWFKRYDDIRWFDISLHKCHQSDEISEELALKEFLKWL